MKMLKTLKKCFFVDFFGRRPPSFNNGLHWLQQEDTIIFRACWIFWHFVRKKSTSIRERVIDMSSKKLSFFTPSLTNHLQSPCLGGSLPWLGSWLTTEATGTVVRKEMLTSPEVKNIPPVSKFLSYLVYLGTVHWITVRNIEPAVQYYTLQYTYVHVSCLALYYSFFYHCIF